MPRSDKFEPPGIVMPYMSKGALDSYLKNKDHEIRTKQVIKWCKELCEGMKFLSARLIVHRDIAARNMLLDNKLGLKISDFGLARTIAGIGAYTGNYVGDPDDQLDFTIIDKPPQELTAAQVHTRNLRKLPRPWLPLESTCEYIFTPKSDVWSTGITIWEMFTSDGMS